MLLKKWEQISKLPAGKKLFSLFLGRIVPYTGSIHPEILELSLGHSRLKIQDRKKIRNHLESIHAAALMNFAEATSGLAFLTGLPDDARAIVVEFTIQYMKKARGTLYGECDCNPPKTSEKSEHIVEARIKDEAGDIVAIGRAKWLISPKR